jgi:hypothetical protein
MNECRQRRKARERRPESEPDERARGGLPMSLLKLSSSDRQVIFECLIAAAKGPFFTDYDLRALFGDDPKSFLGSSPRSRTLRVPRGAFALP